jgi:hypothetical protein
LKISIFKSFDFLRGLFFPKRALLAAAARFFQILAEVYLREVVLCGSYLNNAEALQNIKI